MPDGQTVPHVPQLLGSVRRSAQAPGLHSVLSVGHAGGARSCQSSCKRNDTDSNIRVTVTVDVDAVTPKQEQALEYLAAPEQAVA